MKMKKFVSLVLSASMVLSSAGYALAEAPKDVDGTKYEESVTRLAALDVLKGYEDGTFKPGKTITRAEFAKIMANVVGVGSAAEYAKGQTKFNDVPASHWAAGYINVVSDLEVINGYGDGNFGPNDQVTYAQAITMIVRALGYKPMADAKGGYPGGYLAVAAEKDITDDVNVVSTLAATRGDVALMVDNSLDVGLMEQKTYGQFPEYEETDDTLITKKLDVEELNGIVVNIPATQSSLDDNEIEINVDTDNDGDWDKIETVEVLTDANLMTLLGVEVTVWANDDDEVFFIDQETDEDDILFDTIDKNDTTKEEVTLLVEDDDYEWADDATIFINFEEEKAKDMKKGMYGYVVLDDKGDVEFANLFDFKQDNELVTEVDGDEITIEDSVDVDLEDYEDGVYIMNEKFETIDKDAIAEDSVVSYYTDDEEIWMVAVNETVSGTLDRANNSEIKVAGEEYDTSSKMFYSLDNKDEIENYKSDAELIEDLMDEDVKVILDINKDAKFIYGDVKETSGTMFGLVVKADDAGLDTRVKILTSTDEEVIYKFEESKDFDANKTKLADKNTLVAYELNKDGEIADGKFAVGLAKIESVFSGDYERVTTNQFKADDDGYLQAISDATRYYNEEDTIYFNVEADTDAEIVAFKDIEDIDDTIKTVVALKNKKGNDLVAVVFDKIEDVKTDFLFGVVIEEPSYNADGWVVEVKSYDTDVDSYVIADVNKTNRSEFAEGNIVKFKINGEDEITEVTVEKSEFKVTDTDGDEIKVNGSWMKVASEAVAYSLEDDRDIDGSIGYNDLDEGDIVQYLVDRTEDKNKILALVKLDKEKADDKTPEITTDGTITYANPTTNKIEVDGVVHLIDANTVLRNQVGVIEYDGATAVLTAAVKGLEIFDIKVTTQAGNTASNIITSFKYKAVKADKDAADAVIKLIKDLPAATAADYTTKVVAARSAYDAMPAVAGVEIQKNLVTNLAKLVAAEKVVSDVADAQKAVTDANNFKTTHATILGKTVVTISVSDDVNAVLTAYNLLSAEAKAKLTDEKSLLDSLKVKIEELNDAATVGTVKTALTITGDLNKVSANLTLVGTKDTTTVTWASSNTAIVANDGTVTQPNGANIQVTLTATITKGAATDTKVFVVTVLGV